VTAVTDERRHTILLDPDDEEGGYTVTVPALPGVVTQGETVDECLEHAIEAIALHIEGLVARGLPVREERIRPRLATVSVAASVPDRSVALASECQGAFWALRDRASVATCMKSWATAALRLRANSTPIS